MPKTTTATTGTSTKEPRYQLADMIRADTGLPKPARTIGAYLAGMCDVRQPYAYASQAHLAEKFGMAIRSVSRAVKALEDRGYFTRVRSGTSRGDGWGSNQYHPVWEVLTDPTSRKCLPERNAAGSKDWPVATPEVAGGDQFKVAGGDAGSGGSNRPEVAAVLLEEPQSGNQPEIAGENRAASRTVPVGPSEFFDPHWSQFISSYRWRGTGHNDLPDTYYVPIFRRAVAEYGISGVVRHVSACAQHTQLWSPASFLVNEYDERGMRQ